MPTLPTWDLFITLFFIIGVAFGFILQRDKVVLTTISIYVALVITQTLAEPVLQFFAGDRAILNQVFIKGINNAFAVQATIFTLVIAIVTTKSGLEGKGSGGILSPLELLGYSFLNTALIMSSFFFFMTEEARIAFSEGSKLAHFVIGYHTWWTLLPIILLIALGIKKSD